VSCLYLSENNDFVHVHTQISHDKCIYTHAHAYTRVCTTSEACKSSALQCAELYTITVCRCIRVPLHVLCASHTAVNLSQLTIVYAVTVLLLQQTVYVWICYSLQGGGWFGFQSDLMPVLNNTKFIDNESSCCYASGYGYNLLNNNATTTCQDTDTGDTYTIHALCMHYCHYYNC
jgi:hypothetical protein